MATYSVERAKHATLSGTTVDTVTITGPHSQLEVSNRAAAGGADLFVTVDGTTPTSSGDNTTIIPAGTSALLKADAGDGGTVVKILGNGNTYSVTEESVIRSALPVGADSILEAAVHAEDAAASSGQSGILALAVRRDTPGVTTDTDGDYSELQVSSTGRLRVTLDRTGTATDTADQTVDSTSGGVTILAANANRRGAIIQNVGSANMRVTIDGTAPTTTKGKQLAPGAVLALSMPDCPTSAIKAIREGGTSTSASVTEVV